MEDRDRVEPTPKRPIIIVHGYLASKEMMLPMRMRLERAGFEAHVAQLPALLLGKIEPTAGLLASEIDRILGGYPGGQQCDLLGVSLGGLLALRYLQKFRGDRRVHRYITVGTPHMGSNAARAAVLLLGRISPAAHQLLPDSDLIQGLLREGVPEGVQAMSIYATRDTMAPPSQCALDGAENVEILGSLPPMTHQGLVISGEVIDLIVGFLSRIQDGRPSLEGAAAAG
jgi:triacylglycerol lipase